MTTIWWIRRDLRLHDNPALTAAVAAGDVLPAFVHDDEALNSRYHARATRRRAFLSAGLAVLDEQLRARGSRLVIRSGNVQEELGRLALESGASRIYALADATPFASKRDATVADHLPLTLLPGIGIHPLGSVAKADGAPYLVFSAFCRAWQALSPPTAGELLMSPDRLPTVADGIASESIERAVPLDGFPPGEPEALRRLDAFTLGRDAPLQRYADDRDRPGIDATSALSPYLRFGMLSPRLAATRALEAQNLSTTREGEKHGGASTWLKELIWREFYLEILYRFPRVMRSEFNSRLRDVTWRNDRDDIQAWQTGQTGFPFVDAGMRQLATTGWMHNRARMVVAAFLVKNLLCDWRIGEQWFMDQLIDGDPAANNGGWQWAAGVGTDAAPYFRIFNPVRQGKRFDPSGAYVRRWVPELRGLPDEHVHEPWRASDAPMSYASPIIDLRMSRARALDAYRSVLAE